MSQAKRIHYTINDTENTRIFNLYVYPLTALMKHLVGDRVHV